MRAEIGLRWTIGAVHPRGFEALRLSIAGAWRIFGPQADYAVCVNSLELAEARRQTGPVPSALRWLAPEPRVPEFLTPFLDAGMAEGVAWKFVPLRLFPEAWEVALDNDCILWEMPSALVAWLNCPHAGCLLEADVTRCFGQFTDLCPAAPLNTGIRGFPPGFDPAEALRGVLAERPVLLREEGDEQGLQVAAFSRDGRLGVVGTDEVSICSPFYPHQAGLGSHGAHFVGLNARHLPWDYYGRPALECRAEHWERCRPELHRRVGLSPLPFPPSTA